MIWDARKVAEILAVFASHAALDLDEGDTLDVVCDRWGAEAFSLVATAETSMTPAEWFAAGISFMVHLSEESGRLQDELEAAEAEAKAKAEGADDNRNTH